MIHARWSTEDEVGQRRPRHPPEFYRKWAWSWSAKAWPTVDMMAETFDRYDDILAGFRMQFERGGAVVIQPYEHHPADSGDGFGNFARANRVLFRRDYYGTPHPPSKPTLQEKLQLEHEAARLKRRREQQAESERQWLDETAKRYQAQAAREVREAERYRQAQAEAEKLRGMADEYRAWVERENQKHYGHLPTYKRKI